MGIIGSFSKILSPPPRKREEMTEKPTVRELRRVFSDCADLVERDVITGGGDRAALFFLDGLTGGESVSREVLSPLTDKSRFEGRGGGAEGILSGAVFSATAHRRETLGDVVTDMLCGYCAVLLPDLREAVTFEAKSPERRGVDMPREEKVVKGSKDAFVENLRTNTALVRRKLRDSRLKIAEFTLGAGTGTRTALIYLDGFTNQRIVAEAARRLSEAKPDGVLTAAAIEEYIADSPRTPFPQLLSTERPDKFCLNLLEGRVGIIADGLPVGYLAPGTFAQFFKVPEDAANHFAVGTVLTLLRYIAMLTTLLLPAFFVAAAMYHQEMIPAKLLQSMIDAKQAVPFSAPVEVLLMLASFELLQEAGLRLSNPVGETVSIIGALIVGQSAVDAKIVSPAVVIIVALAGVSGYTMPNQDMAAAMRLCRFLLVLCAIGAGMFGLTVGCALLLYHLCTLESFGVPYMTPFAGADARELLRAFVRFPLRSGSLRERALHTENGNEN